MILERVTGNPIIERGDIPAIPPAFVDVSSVFNPGAARVDDRVLLLLRVQSRGRETGLVRAWSHDGFRFRVAQELVEVRGPEEADLTAHHVYDPRLTVVDGEVICTVAMDTDEGCRIGTGRLGADGVLALAGVSPPDSRNGVVFPGRVDGRWLRLERPVATHFQGVNVYQAGAALLDLEDPLRVVARTRRNILEPRDPYELAGQVPNVVFPTGWVADAVDADGFVETDAELKIYYGAADTVVGLAVGNVGDLLGACRDAG